MITSFDRLNIGSLNFYQNTVLNKLLPFLNKVDIALLSKESYIDHKKGTVTISLNHKDDLDTRLIFNIHEDYLSVWYGICNISYYKNEDQDISEEEIVYLLKSKYQSVDFFYKHSKIYSIIKFDDDLIPKSVVSFSWFSKIINLLFFKRIEVREVSFKPFFRSGM